MLSEENFMKAPWLNLFKVRASYGIAGRADYAVNLYKDLWGTGNAFFSATALTLRYRLQV